MPLPLILGAAALVAAGYGAKKGYDGYQDSSDADNIFEEVKRKGERIKKDLKSNQDKLDSSLESLGQLQLDIANNFTEFKRMSDDILSSLGKSDLDKNLAINLPKNKLDQIKQVEISAASFLASMAGGAVVGGVASFAAYSGVMAFAAASTGTPIAALSGAAAYNATMAAIGGGSLAAGGFGMAGGAAVLGGVVAAPIVAIMGHVYAAQAEEKLSKAKEARREVDKASDKIYRHIIPYLQETNLYVTKIKNALNELHSLFQTEFFDMIKVVHAQLDSLDNLPIKEDKLMQLIGNGMALCALMADIITTPLFKMKKLDNEKIEIEKDEHDCQVLNKDGIECAIIKAKLS